MLYWVTAAVLLVYLLLVWFFAGWVNPPGSGIWVLRIGLSLIGILGAAFTTWWLRREKKAQGDVSSAAPGGTTEVDLLVRDAVRKLKSSAMGRGSSLRNLPLIFLVGDPGSAKTTTVIHSALDPELLAGHVYQDNNVVPTRVANFWYTRQAVFVDGGGSLYSQPDLWRRLIRLVQPGRVAAAGGQQQAPRAAIVCFDCEMLRAGSQDQILSAARRLGTRLLEISQTLGISFPIYVLFTKADRVGARSDGGSAFLDYVAGLGKDETSQVLGATLPVRSLQATGVYADEETRRLEKAFDELFYSLAEKRIDFLGAASQAEKLAGIYEFPRELRKLRQYAVPFLVELARPSQLSVNPFLRGFYFAGVRPVVIEGASAPISEPAAEPAFDGNATVVFGAGSRRPAAPVAVAPTSGRRKVPEWVFLSQLFNEVLLKDRVALSASGFSSRVSLLRRVALASVTVIALIFALGFLTSFIGNFFLERDVKQAVEDVQRIHSDGQTATFEQLTKLDTLRQKLEPLSAYYNGKKDAPWSLRWGMYSGDDFYPNARQAYFQSFNDLLFADTLRKLLHTLQTGKERPDPTESGDQYQITYNDLRAYLVTTRPQDAKYSTRDFLSPVLMKHWRESRAPDESMVQLAGNQFDFYSNELAISNPYSLSSDLNAIARAQDYLGGFSGIERYYFPVLEKAHTAGNRDIGFRTVFPGDSGAINSPDVVRAAFTREGYAVVQSAINAPANQMSEEWVLGRAAAQELDPTVLRQRLKERYLSDFVQTWSHVLSNAHVNISTANPRENARGLEVLTGPASPLLELVWLVSHNTNVDNPDILNAFASVQGVVPPPPDKGLPALYKVPSNQPYMDALSKLREDMSILANSNLPPSDTHLSDGANASAQAVITSAERVAGNQVDATYHVRDMVAKLLKEPAVAAQAAIGGAGKIGLNGGGQSFCRQLDQLKGFFPFNPTGPDLPIDQLNTTLGAGPNSALQIFYTTRLSQFLVKQGTNYVANESAAIRLSPNFVAAFNRLMHVSSSLYPNGSSTPRVEYSLKQVAATMDGVALKVGGDTLTGTQPKTFAWTGSNDNIVSTVRDSVEESTSGPWAFFHFINDSRQRNLGNGTYDLEFVKQVNGHDLTVNGRKQSYTYELRFANGNPWADFSSGISCVSQVTR